MSYIIMTVDEITFLNSKLINNFKMKSKLRPQILPLTRLIKLYSNIQKQEFLA